MLGNLTYVAPLFDPNTLLTIENQLIGTAGNLFSSNVVTEIIEPTISDIVTGTHNKMISLEFVISL